MFLINVHMINYSEFYDSLIIGRAIVKCYDTLCKEFCEEKFCIFFCIIYIFLYRVLWWILYHINESTVWLHVHFDQFYSILLEV